MRAARAVRTADFGPGGRDWRWPPLAHDTRHAYVREDSTRWAPRSPGAVPLRLFAREPDPLGPLGQRRRAATAAIMVSSPPPVRAYCLRRCLVPMLESAAAPGELVLPPAAGGYLILPTPSCPRIRRTSAFEAGPLLPGHITARGLRGLRPETEDCRWRAWHSMVSGLRAGERTAALPFP